MCVCVFSVTAGKGSPFLSLSLFLLLSVSTIPRPPPRTSPYLWRMRPFPDSLSKYPNNRYFTCVKALSLSEGLGRGEGELKEGGAGNAECATYLISLMLSNLHMISCSSAMLSLSISRPEKPTNTPAKGYNGYNVATSSRLGALSLCGRDLEKGWEL